MTEHPRPTDANLLRRLVAPLNSVTLGIVLLALLFVYSSIGSAGLVYPIRPNVFNLDNWVYVQLRQLRLFEMTEFEWFHWWPFDLLIGLICATIIVVTLSRIRLNALNLGVWLIHSGVITLCVGSVIYFSTKVEGDTPVARREVHIRLPSGEEGRLVASPGNGLALGKGEGQWLFRIANCNPDWEIRAEEHEGTKAFSVTVDVTGSGGTFQRQLLAGYPQYTEDVLKTDDPSQPMQRAVKALGRPLVDESLAMSLELSAQTHVYLANWVQKSWALYLRERRPDGSASPWAQRPVEGLPLYNDYVADPADVLIDEGQSMPFDPLAVSVPAWEPADPLPGVPLTIKSYLRYAEMRTQRLPGGERLDPFVNLRLMDHDAVVGEHQLLAFNRSRNTAERGFFGLQWIHGVAERERLASPRAPAVVLSIPGTDVRVEESVSDVSLSDPDLPWKRLGESEYEYRIEFVVPVQEHDLPPLASVELRTSERSFRRWVFGDGRRPRDVSASQRGANRQMRLVPEEEYPQLDSGIEVAFEMGHSPAPVQLVAGPGEQDLGVVFNLGAPSDGRWMPVQVGEAVALGRGQTFLVTKFAARSVAQTLPRIVPVHHRERDAREELAQVQVEIGGSDESSVWVPFANYVFEGDEDLLYRFRFRPARTTLPDGRTLELILSRQRLPLPHPVVLEDFHVTAHVGGFTGRTSSILNWTSQVRFVTGQGYTEPMAVAVNEPAEHEGFWFFQSMWDPPSPPRFAGDTGSGGLTYTVLGVGNRHGVVVQLLGCAVSVIGMLYAFYVKPQIRRRRAAAVPSAPPASPARKERKRRRLAPVAGVMEDQA